MVEVRMKTISAGPDGTYGIGDKRMVSEAEAEQLVPNYAEFTVLPVEVSPQPAQEKAVIFPEETAAKVAAPLDKEKPVAEAPAAPKVEETAAKVAPWGNKK